MYPLVKVKVYNEDLVFGPGLTMLLARIQETESMKEACSVMGMSYSKAWRIVKTAEEEIGFPILERKAGGAGGGFSRLTEQGREFLEAFESFERETMRAAEELFQKYFHQRGIEG